MAKKKGCTMMARKHNAALYVRVSTDGQTIENQVRELRQIAERRGWEIVETYLDTTPARRRREILLPEGIGPEHVRPIRSETRARLVAAIVRGRRWLAELIADPTASADSIAKREQCSARKINMTISLAFLAPDLVKAAIDGRLPHGMGVARLTDLPAEWSRQHQMLGLPAR
jgi:site-specific DNA recombinase